ncbi:hypothetical protein H8356DRAFT_1731452 [Neocallimastix lanati (nom. inval.)]|jgi:hypothetical protein|uniref:Uncharacterized protein n=1 Tax=Neocallimastix californiae TaxID=1754190 RepID=A0A1Y2BZZ6_9FUNG|nr:hypothetical protein H8356DRAFT_1731452 [Neocallimastix sp. JGI-2020a]ORY40331.1 hypothetical protein LY90DRAFT_37062 [Neocallimastix californiae]|eukprot:ORY40331.1 hypothetical protein LY90DRAFT_37062 [Neocallimastix californiae]
MWPFKPAETILLKKMDANPFYPYILRNDDLVINERNKYYWLSLLMLIIFLAGSLIIGFAYGFLNLWFLIFALCFVASFIFYLSKVGVNVYRLIADDEMYVFIKFGILGKKVTVSDIYNIYIRVKKIDRWGTRKYFLILGGYKMNPLSISGKTKNIDELRRLGVMIAENLNINFFDYPNCSPHHAIIHYPPDYDYDVVL